VSTDIPGIGAASRAEAAVEVGAGRRADEGAHAGDGEWRGREGQRGPRAAAEREPQRDRVRGREQEHVLDEHAVAAEADGERALARARVGRAIAEVVDDEDRGRERADRDGGPRGERGHVAELHERGAAHRDEPEEHHHEHVAEAVIAERVGTARVRDARQDREHADDRDRPAGDADQVEPERRRDRERGDHRALHRARADQAGADGARRADAIRPIGAALGVEHVVREVRPDLDRERAGERGERRAPRDAARGRRARGADRDGHDRGWQRARARRREPDRAAGGCGRRGCGDGHGRPCAQG